MKAQTALSQGLSGKRYAQELARAPGVEEFLVDLGADSFQTETMARAMKAQGPPMKNRVTDQRSEAG